MRRHPQPCTRRRVREETGTVHGCWSCATDYAFRLADLPNGTGRLFFLTTRTGLRTGDPNGTNVGTFERIVSDLGRVDGFVRDPEDIGWVSRKIENDL